MTPLICLSLVTLAIFVTMLLCGIAKGDEDLGIPALLLILAWLISFAAFQKGAGWQREEWQEKFNLEPKAQTAK